MKPVNEVYTETDIDNLISEQTEEGPFLEFKRAESLTDLENTNITPEKRQDKKIEIARDASAFANSGGGILIYGFAEKGHKADSKSFINGELFTKERLEQLNADKIRRPIEFTIDSIRCGGDVKKIIYVVRIPKSNSSPHQIESEGKYYKRGNFRKMLMKEDEVRDFYRKQDSTTLEIHDPIVVPGAVSESRGKVTDCSE